MAKKKQALKEPSRADLFRLMYSLPILQDLQPLQKAVLELRLRFLPEERIAATYEFFRKEKEFMNKVFTDLFSKVKKVDVAYTKIMKKIEKEIDKKTNKKK